MNDNWIQESVDPAARQWEEFYRNRFQHDKRVRTTHGVNCTGSCSWEVFVKDGIVTWEMQATDYPELEEGLPPYEPRGCQRGASFSWYLYSPIRVKYPYARGELIDMWREANKRALGDPVAAWEIIQTEPGWRERYQQARGKGGFRRISWDEALDIAAASTVYTTKTSRPRPRGGLLPDPCDVADQLRRGQPVPLAARRRGDELLRLVLRPAACLARDLGRADRRARGRRLVQQPVCRRRRVERQHDSHARHALPRRGAPRRRQTGRVQPRLLDGRQVRRLVDPGQCGPGCGVLARRRPRDPDRVVSRPHHAVFRRLRQAVHRPAVPRRDRRRRQPGALPTCQPSQWLRGRRARRLEAARVGRRGRRAPHAQRHHRLPVGGGREGPLEPRDVRQGRRRQDQPAAQLHRSPRRRRRRRVRRLRRGCAGAEGRPGAPRRHGRRPGGRHDRVRPADGPLRRAIAASPGTTPPATTRKTSPTPRRGRRSTPASTATP